MFILGLEYLIETFNQKIKESHIARSILNEQSNLLDENDDEIEDMNWFISNWETKNEEEESDVFAFPVKFMRKKLFSKEELKSFRDRKRSIRSSFKGNIL